MSKTIAGDETFTRFRRKLEDAVTVAINSGKAVVPMDYDRKKTDTFCPLGCWPGVSSRRPFAGHAAKAGVASQDDCFAFLRGFEGSDDADQCGGDSPYFQLGKLYRERFK